MNRWLVVLGATIVATAACASDPGGGGEPLDLEVIADQPAGGTIAGRSWTVGTRYMNVTSGELFVDLLSDPVADCTRDETEGSYPFIIFFTPAVPGRYELDFATRTVTFVDRPSNNLIVTRGVIEIDAITATQVTGGLHVFDEEFGEINGRFDGKLCFSNDR